MNDPRSMSRGFRILQPLELLNWRPIDIGASVPLESQTACPACANALNTLAVLSATSGTAIRVGVCEQCGYTGYMDRPARAWISRYYAEVWTHGTEKDIVSLREKWQPDNPSSRAVRKALALLPDRSRPILEIGSGYGTMLRFALEHGFPNVIGIESSRHRAETAREATGLPILSGDFESEAVQTELRKHAPFGLIYLFHVLEHTYHPAEIIAAIGRLQSPGDILVIGVPNLEGEPAMNILLFLPHLHSFTATALTHLLNRAGYEVVDTSGSDDIGLNVIARKLPPGHSRTAAGANAPPDAVAKFIRELALADLAPSGRPLDAARGKQRYFWSKKDAALSGIEPYRWYWRAADSFRSRRNMRSLLIEPPAEPASSAPFVFTFAGDPFLCIK